MKKHWALVAVCSVLLPSIALTFPSVYPTGTLVFRPDKTWSGFTLVGLSWWKDHNTYLIDMNGNIVREWPGLMGHSAKMLPNGHVTGQFGERKKAHARQLDWEGNVVWSYDGAYVSHDLNREGNPVGYYAPGLEPRLDRGRSLLNAQFTGKKGARERPEIMDGLNVQGNFLLEVDWDGKVLWEWDINDHYGELGLGEAGRKAVRGIPQNGHLVWSPNSINAGSYIDWAHINALSWVGPNQWYEAGDERFHPDNVLWTSRNNSIIAITSRKTNEIVWQIGPDYDSDPRLRAIGPIIGSHGAHIIPRGLPGAGNLLVLDNGGWSVYGAPTPGSFHGIRTTRRHYSRVLEINPVTLKVVWEYTAEKAGHGSRRTPHQFATFFQGNAQRLPNGNTFVTEASYGRLFELTPDLELVWEFVEPRWRQPDNENPVFRAYRVPYEWVPQLERPEDRAVIPPKMSQFQLRARGEEVAQPIVLANGRKESALASLAGDISERVAWFFLGGIVALFAVSRHRATGTTDG